MINLTLNGKPIKAKNGQTILEVATANGIKIPTLCHDEELKPFGSCWVCAVKVLNRKGFDEKVARLVKNSDPKKRLGIIYFDMDNLKYINDTHSHKMGDKAILNVMEKLTATVRDRDIVARLGGDEFVIYGLAQRLHKQVSKDKGKKYSTTLSMGVHIVKVEDISKNVEDLEKFSAQFKKEVEKADKAAYKSKEDGKNKVSVTKEFLKYYKL